MPPPGCPSLKLNYVLHASRLASWQLNMACVVHLNSAPLKMYDVRKTDRKFGSGAFGTIFEVEWNGATCAAKFIATQHRQRRCYLRKRSKYLSQCLRKSAPRGLLDLRHPQIVS